MEIRLAKPEEWVDLKRLNQDLFNYEKNNFDPTLKASWPDENEDYYKEATTKENKVIFVFEQMGKIEGYIIACFYNRPDYRMTARKVEIENMYIANRYRGLGVGSKLMNKVEDWARSKGAAEISVGAWASNTDALAFYRNKNFKKHEIILEKKL